MYEQINVVGELQLFVYENEALVKAFKENNLVVSLGKENAAKLIGGIIGGAAITKIGVGTNGTATDVADNALTAPFTKDISSVTQPAPNKVMFHFDIPDTEANGMTIREFGLLTAAGVLCARKVRGEDIVKTNAVRLVGTWTITIN